MHNTIAGQITSTHNESGEELLTIRWQQESLTFIVESEALTHKMDEEIELYIPAESIILQEAGKGKSTAINRMMGKIVQIRHYAIYTWIEFECRGQTFTSLCPTSFASELNWRPGTRVEAIFPFGGIQIQTPVFDTGDQINRIA